MSFIYNNTISIIILSLALNSCSSKPSTFAANTEATPEIQAAEASLQEALQNQVDVFAPISYEAAKDALDDAKDSREDNDSNEEILVAVEKTRALTNKAVQKAEVAKTALPGVAEVRLAALRAEAHKSQKEQLKDADDDLADFTRDVERGRIAKTDKISGELLQKYTKLEIDATKAMKLGVVDNNIKKAKDEGAEDNAPKSLAVATKAYAEAVALIEADPRNLAAIDPAAGKANFESEKLLRVTRKAKAAGGSKAEDVILQAESQRDYIDQQGEVLATVIGEKTAVEQEAASLKSLKALQDKVAAISEKFNSNEADVYQQGKNIIIRLKGIKFASGKSEIPSTSFETLKKVQESVLEIGNAKVKVQGHADATGSRMINQSLSEERASSVKNYLTANLDLDEEIVESAGFGSTRPIQGNKTPAGRAANRRIDIVLESDWQLAR